jgi:hypothetical protein
LNPAGNAKPARVPKASRPSPACSVLAGKLLAVESLATPARATRVRVRSGQPQMLDGPFAEAKEMIGGFYLVECASPDEALAIARRCPAAEWATVEVRPVSPCYEESNA